MMLRERFGSRASALGLSLALATAACGGGSRRTSADVEGGGAVAGSTAAGAAGGGSASTGGGGASAGGGGSSAGGSAGAGNGGTSAGGGVSGSAGATLPPPEPVPASLVGREYLIDVPDLGSDATHHLRVISTTQARFAGLYSFSQARTLEYRPGTSLGSVTATPPASSTLNGPFFIYPVAIGETAAGEPSSEALFLEVFTCFGGSMVHGATVRADDTPTAVRANPGTLSGAMLPWETFELEVSKPLPTSVSEVVDVTVSGEPVTVEWSEPSDEHASSVQWGSVMDWSSIVGRTLEVSGNVTGTNGVTGPISSTIRIADFGPVRSSPVDFTAGLPSELVGLVGAPQAFPTYRPADSVPTSGIPRYAPPGTEMQCPSGCAVMAAGTTVLLRVTGSGTWVRIRGTAEGSVGIQAWRPSGPGSKTMAQGEFVADLTVYPGSDDVFVAFTTMLGKAFIDLINADCGNFFDVSGTLYLESVELLATP